MLKNVKVWDDGTNPGETRYQDIFPEMVTEVSWPTYNGVEYDVMESSNLEDWSDFGNNVKAMVVPKRLQ